MFGTTTSLYELKCFRIHVDWLTTDLIISDLVQLLIHFLLQDSFYQLLKISLPFSTPTYYIPAFENIYSLLLSLSQILLRNIYE